MKKKSAQKKGAAKKAAGKFAARKAALKRAARTKDVVRQRMEVVKTNDPAMPLPRFVERVNQISARYVPAGQPDDSRVTTEFNPRSVRHYQAKGIIDSPSKEGKEARYGYRHILQAVLVRIMLADGFRAPGIAKILADRTLEEYEEMLSMPPGAARKMAMKKRAGKKGAAKKAAGQGGCGSGVSRYVRVSVAPGIEIHIDAKMAPPADREEAEKVHAKVTDALRGEFQRRRRRLRNRETA